MISIKGNTTSVQVVGDLSRLQKSIFKNTERLTTGLRINTAGDDVAGLSMASKMGAKLRSLQQVERNINDGVSFLQTVDGGLEQIQQRLRRASELAVQAGNEINSAGQRAALDHEFQMLLQDIERITGVIETVDGQNPLASQYTAPDLPGIQSIEDLYPSNGGTNTGVVSGTVPYGYIPGNSDLVDISIDSGVMDDDLQIFTRDGKHVAGTNLTDAVWAGNGVTDVASMEAVLFTTANGFFDTASYDDSSLVESGSGSLGGMGITYSGEQQPASNVESLQLTYTSEPLLVFVIGTGNFNTTASWDGLGTDDSVEGMKIKVTELGSTYDTQGTFDVDAAPSDLKTLQLNERNLLSLPNSQEAVDALQAANDIIGAYRAEYGSSINALGAQLDRASEARVNLSRSKMAVSDVDFAEETSELARTEIQKSIASSMMGQARQIEEMALRLIQNTLR